MGIFASKQDLEAEKAYLEIRRKTRQDRPDAWLYDFVAYTVTFLDLYKVPIAIGGFVFLLLMFLLGMRIRKNLSLREFNPHCYKSC